MCESLNQKINRFRQVYNHYIDVAFSETNLEDKGVYAGVLICSIFDSLAKSRFPNVSGNKKRFLKLVEECDSWTDQGRVSLLHVSRALRKLQGADADKFSELRRWVDEKMEKDFRIEDSMRTQYVHIKLDPELNEICEHWPRISSSDDRYEQICGKDPSFFQHKNLFWLYRNSIIHEFRIPGLGREYPDYSDEKPYYQKMGNLENMSVDGRFDFSYRWELVYPISFLKSLTKCAVDKVVEFYRSDNSSPFEPYTEGTYWIPELNEDP